MTSEVHKKFGDDWTSSYDSAKLCHFKMLERPHKKHIPVAPASGRAHQGYLFRLHFRLYALFSF